MTDYIPSREDAYKLLTKHVQDESLINHSLSVEAVMAHFADKFDEDIEKWSVIGLIHDLDFEKHPDEHCKITKQILEEEAWPEEYIRGVMSHAWISCTDVEPEHIMEKIIYTIDELTGLVYATALMRPSKSILDLKPKSVKKKFKQKSFAAGVDREVITKGLEMLDMELNDLIDETIKGMQNVADEIGLRGNL